MYARVLFVLLGVAVGVGFTLIAAEKDASSTAAAPPEAAKDADKKDGKKKGAKKHDPSDAFFEAPLIPTLRVEVAPDKLDELRRDPRLYVRATVNELTHRPDEPAWVHTLVGVHLRGAAGSFRQVDDRPGLTLNFDRYVDEQRFHGLDKFHLNNSIQDPTLLNEVVGSFIFRKAGLPAPRVSHAHVFLNGRDLGLYVLKEGFDPMFMKRFFKDREGTLFEGNFVDVDGKLPPKLNEKRADTDVLKALVAASREPEPSKRREKLDAVLDVDRFLTLIALEAMVCHWDGYGFNRNNYRIYHDPTSTKLVFLATGMDQIFQRADHPLFPGAGMVARAVTEHPEDRAAYIERIAALRKTVLDPAPIIAEVDRASAAVSAALARISPDAVKHHQEQAKMVRERIVQRARGIDQLLNTIPKPLQFGSDGVASLVGWAPKHDAGNPTHEQAQEGDRKVLRIRAGAGGATTASYRTTVLLGKGKYTLEGDCRALNVATAEGANTGVGLRISGGQREQRLTGTTEWQPCRFEFEVSEGTREVVLVCELRAESGEAQFDLKSLRLRKR